MPVNPEILTQMAALLAALQREVQTLHEAVRAQTALLVLLHPMSGEIPPDDNPAPDETPTDADGEAPDDLEEDQPDLPELETPPSADA